MNEFWLFIAFILFLFFAWIATGGPARNELNRTHPFIVQPAPNDDGKVYSLQEIKNR